ncbi:MAG: alpha/beta fold hydrolase [Candidatus Thorarchaeota archaeon]
MKRGFVDGKDVRLAYVDFGGSGLHAVLLHGAMSRAANWFETALWLREKYHVIGIDQRGHGRSDKPDSGYTRANLVEDIANALSELNVREAIVIGHSMGALIAWGLAIAYPQVVKALILVDKGARAPPKEALEDWKEWFQSWPVPFSCLKEARHYFENIRPSFGDHFMELLEERKSGYWPLFHFEHILAALRFSLGKSWWDELDRIECPTLIIKGEESQFRRKDAEKMAQIIPQGRFVEIPEAGHVVYDDQPGRFREAVENFLIDVSLY